MRLLLVFIIIMFMNTLWADTQVSTQIHDIDMGSANEEPLIFLTTGQVVTLKKLDKGRLDSLREGMKKKSWFKISLNHKKQITHIELIEAPYSSPPLLLKRLYGAQKFTPSILKDLNQARSFFNEARSNARQVSECYNRAHVWTYEWRINHHLYSSKVWLFFTRRFIRKYKFDWWFHVAPMVHVIVNGEVKERILDIKYAKGPTKLKIWTDIFLRDRADCPVVKKYSDQANHPESGSCFVMKSSMYYYQPVDLEQLELTGIERNLWSEAEVKNAYLDAFEIEL
ncbi:MAG: protein-glutamine glutaminase family protein [Bacteriovoracaceae bacterium]|nr:protein-glutamine glutaminase family protein [Bacteriovoracaceae bacterium]